MDFPANCLGPIEARAALATVEGADNLGAGVPVLLVFENGDTALPVIVGIVRDVVSAPTPREMTLRAERPADVAVDNRKVVIDAKEEIVLRCGKGSITLTKDGKVVIKGTYLVSRSAGLNKIQGAGVKIN